MPNIAAKSARILIAADAPLEALALEDILRNGGHQNVRITSDTREIMPLHEKWPFVLLLLDMGVCSLNGFDVLAQLQAPLKRRQMAVVALTHAGAEDRALSAGATSVLCRPLMRAYVLLQVREALAALPGPSVDEVVLNAVSKRFAPVFD